MSVYEELEFAPVLITDVFRPHKGKRLISAHRKDGKTPFVGGSESFNSVTGFSDVEPLFPGGWLTLTYNGSVGHAKLQPAPFFASDDVIALEPLDGCATDQALLVLASIITRECVAKYSYGVKLNLARLMKQTIMAPVTTDADGEQVVDWDGMARLGEELFAEVITHTHSARQTDAGDNDSLPDLRFEPMLITDVFDKYRQAPAWLNTNQVKQGEAAFPHVTNSAASNSVSGFIAHQGVDPNPGNAITVGIDTQVVAYQPVPFYGATKVYELRSPQLTEDSAPILVSALKKGVEKFSWGHKASAGRLSKTRIMVPVTMSSDGEQAVDWEGMAQYGRALRVRAERHAFDEAVMT